MFRLLTLMFILGGKMRPPKRLPRYVPDTPFSRPPKEPERLIPYVLGPSTTIASTTTAATTTTTTTSSTSTSSSSSIPGIIIPDPVVVGPGKDPPTPHERPPHERPPVVDPPVVKPPVVKPPVDKPPVDKPPVDKPTQPTQPTLPTNPTDTWDKVHYPANEQNLWWQAKATDMSLLEKESFIKWLSKQPDDSIKDYDVAKDGLTGLGEQKPAHKRITDWMKWAGTHLIRTFPPVDGDKIVSQRTLDLLNSFYGAFKSVFNRQGMSERPDFDHLGLTALSPALRKLYNNYLVTQKDSTGQPLVETGGLSRLEKKQFGDWLKQPAQRPIRDYYAKNGITTHTIGELMPVWKDLWDKYHLYTPEYLPRNITKALADCMRIYLGNLPFDPTIGLYQLPTNQNNDFWHWYEHNKALYVIPPNSPNQPQGDGPNQPHGDGPMSDLEEEEIHYKNWYNEWLGTPTDQITDATKKEGLLKFQQWYRAVKDKEPTMDCFRNLTPVERTQFHIWLKMDPAMSDEEKEEIDFKNWYNEWLQPPTITDATRKESLARFRTWYKGYFLVDPKMDAFRQLTTREEQDFKQWFNTPPTDPDYAEKLAAWKKANADRAAAKANPKFDTDTHDLSLTTREHLREFAEGYYTGDTTFAPGWDPMRDGFKGMTVKEEEDFKAWEAAKYPATGSSRPKREATTIIPPTTINSMAIGSINTMATTIIPPSTITTLATTIIAPAKLTPSTILTSTLTPSTYIRPTYQDWYKNYFLLPDKNGVMPPIDPHRYDQYRQWFSNKFDDPQYRSSPAPDLYINQQFDRLSTADQQDFYLNGGGHLISPTPGGNVSWTTMTKPFIATPISSLTPAKTLEPWTKLHLAERIDPEPLPDKIVIDPDHTAIEHHINIADITPRQLAGYLMENGLPLDTPISKIAFPRGADQDHPLKVSEKTFLNWVDLNPWVTVDLTTIPDFIFAGFKWERGSKEEKTRVGVQTFFTYGVLPTYEIEDLVPVQEYELAKFDHIHGPLFPDWKSLDRKVLDTIFYYWQDHYKLVSLNIDSNEIADVLDYAEPVQKGSRIEDLSPLELYQFLVYYFLYVPDFVKAGYEYEKEKHPNVELITAEQDFFRLMEFYHRKLWILKDPRTVSETHTKMWEVSLGLSTSLDISQLSPLRHYLILDYDRRQTIQDKIDYLHKRNAELIAFKALWFPDGHADPKSRTVEYLKEFYVSLNQYINKDLTPLQQMNELTAILQIDFMDYCQKHALFDEFYQWKKGEGITDPKVKANMDVNVNPDHVTGQFQYIKFWVEGLSKAQFAKWTAYYKKLSHKHSVHAIHPPCVRFEDEIQQQQLEKFISQRPDLTGYDPNNGLGKMTLTQVEEFNKWNNAQGDTIDTALGYGNYVHENFEGKWVHTSFPPFDTLRSPPKPVVNTSPIIGTSDNPGVPVKKPDAETTTTTTTTYPSGESRPSDGDKVKEVTTITSTFEQAIVWSKPNARITPQIQWGIAIEEMDLKGTGHSTQWKYKGGTVWTWPGPPPYHYPPDWSKPHPPWTKFRFGYKYVSPWTHPPCVTTMPSGVKKYLYIKQFQKKYGWQTTKGTTKTDYGTTIPKLVPAVPHTGFVDILLTSDGTVLGNGIEYNKISVVDQTAGEPTGRVFKQDFNGEWYPFAQRDSEGNLRRLQPQADWVHSILFTHKRHQLTWHYERPVLRLEDYVYSERNADDYSTDQYIMWSWNDKAHGYIPDYLIYYEYDVIDEFYHYTPPNPSKPTTSAETFEIKAFPVETTIMPHPLPADKSPTGILVPEWYHSTGFDKTGDFYIVDGLGYDKDNKDVLRPTGKQYYKVGNIWYGSKTIARLVKTPVTETHSVR